MAKVVSAQEAVAGVKDGMSIMAAGFLSVGGGNEVLHAIAEKGVFSIGNIYEWKRTGKGSIAFGDVTCITDCLFANHIRSYIHFLTLGFQDAHSHTIDKKEVIGLTVSH